MGYRFTEQALILWLCSSPRLNNPVEMAAKSNSQVSLSQSRSSAMADNKHEAEMSPGFV